MARRKTHDYAGAGQRSPEISRPVMPDRATRRAHTTWLASPRKAVARSCTQRRCRRYIPDFMLVFSTFQAPPSLRSFEVPPDFLPDWSTASIVSSAVSPKS